MTVGTNAGSITAAGHGTITNISINLNSGTVTAEKDANAGSGVISNATVGTMAPTGQIIAETELVNLSVTTIQGGNFEAGRFGTVSATNVVADEVRLVADDATRTLKVGAVPGFVKPESFSFTYNGTAPGNPVTTVQINPGPATNIRYDFSLLTDTVGVAGSGIDLKSFTSNGKAFLRNLVVAGDLKPAARDAGREPAAGQCGGGRSRQHPGGQHQGAERRPLQRDPSTGSPPPTPRPAMQPPCSPRARPWFRPTTRFRRSPVMACRWRCSS